MFVWDDLRLVCLHTDNCRLKISKLIDSAAFASTITPDIRLLEVHDQGFPVLGMYVFLNAAFFSKQKGGGLSFNASAMFIAS
jgi:hypothetical protein